MSPIFDLGQITSTPDYMSSEEADKCLDANWDNISPTMAVVNYFAVQLKRDPNSGCCPCSDISIRQGGSILTEVCQCTL